MDAHAVAISAPDRLPAKPGLMYSPPDQSVMLVYWCFLRSSEKRMDGQAVDGQPRLAACSSARRSPVGNVGALLRTPAQVRRQVKQTASISRGTSISPGNPACFPIKATPLQLAAPACTPAPNART